MIPLLIACANAVTQYAVHDERVRQRAKAMAK